MAEEQAEGGLKRSVSWKQGLFIAMGVPILILPSLADVSTIVWGLCIFVWTISVLQGFLQNMAYGEMVTVFPKATGLPGCAQTVFKPKNPGNPHDMRKFIGAFSAWCYWFAWCPVVAIFTMMIGDYLVQMFEWDIEGWTYLGLYMAVGLIIVAVMYVLGVRGLEGGARLGMILAIVSVIPIIIIVAGAFISGEFEFSNITDNITAPGWSWDFEDIVLLFGCFGLAQWSACAWETAAIYGPEYENPGKDVPKALFSCGMICLFMYFFVSVGVYGSFDQSNPDDAALMTNAILAPLSEAVFGDTGKYVALFLLIVAMVLVIQTGFLGSSRTLYSMAGEGNLPDWFGKVNGRGMPANAMLFVCIFNMLLVFIVGYSGCVAGSGDTSSTILSASAIGYCLANGIALAAFVKSRRDPEFRDLPRPYSAPKCWIYPIAAMVFVQFVLWFPCLVYWSYNLGDSITPAIIAGIILICYLPVWWMVQTGKSGRTAEGVASD
ncbi:amino acid permease [Candidatus Methanomethylophilus sp. 1R26]|uniref:APC family permease n=1 Tax=Candidatus Methanomethylophilus sp. 1R26 TaxID=1769296 RepID=UPI000736007E|nr:APC family permease [Candidatus Methanomethylophilus sp. 1R26]KUE73493.1 amino acid permease [Candidatus Methanomethylophilus sp. 1R26]TQS81080.1 MAG: amino acid permease [Methanomethylophilus alvi]